MRTGVTEREGLEKERECCRAVWRRTGRRKESYNVGVPTGDSFVLALSALISISHPKFWQEKLAEVEGVTKCS